jgi:hypothetical protein
MHKTHFVNEQIKEIDANIYHYIYMAIVSFVPFAR